MSVEEETDFTYRCPKCGYHGFACSDKVWKYCPLCGADLEIKVEEYEEGEA